MCTRKRRSSRFEWLLEERMSNDVRENIYNDKNHEQPKKRRKKRIYWCSAYTKKKYEKNWLSMHRFRSARFVQWILRARFAHSSPSFEFCCSIHFAFNYYGQFRLTLAHYHAVLFCLRASIAKSKKKTNQYKKKTIYTHTQNNPKRSSRTRILNREKKK